MITAEMVREAQAHTPFALLKTEQWEWQAQFLNRAIQYPNIPCPCCKCTPAGDVLDHLDDAQILAMQPSERKANDAKVNGHILWGKWDKGIPDVLVDRNGDVVLGMCKLCGSAEADLFAKCTGEKK